MAKLTKAQNAQYNKVLDLVNSDKKLTYEDKIFIYENYDESANVNIREVAAFHTPLSLAWDFSIDAGTWDSVVDLCAGIGILAFCVFHRTSKDCEYYSKNFKPQFLCVEYIKDYVDLGKRLLPEADWVCGDALTYDVLDHRKNRRKFDMMISNPPFGNIKTSKDYKPNIYKGADFEFKIIERGKQIAHNSTLIVINSSSPFKYSGSRDYQELPNSKAAKFSKETNIAIHAGCGIDTSYHKDLWKNTKIICEVLNIDYHYDIKLNTDYARMEKKLKFIRDTDENINDLPNAYVDFIFTELDFESINKRQPEIERLLGKSGRFFHQRHNIDLDKTKLKEIIEMFTCEGQTVLHYGVYSDVLAKLCLKLKRKYIGIADSKRYDKLKPKFKELKEKYNSKPKKNKSSKKKKRR